MKFWLIASDLLPLRLMHFDHTTSAEFNERVIPVIRGIVFSSSANFGLILKKLA